MERGAEIVVFNLQAIVPGPLVRGVECQARGRREVHQPLRMTLMRLLRLMTRRELFQRKLANRFQHAETRFAVRAPGSYQQVLVNQRGNQVEDGCWKARVILHSRHLFDRVQGEAAAEDGQTAEEDLFGWS